MNCPESSILMAYMDGELEPESAASIREHLAGCGECRAFLETQEVLERSWRDSWQDPPDFRFSAMRKRLETRNRKKAAVPAWLIGVAAGVAAVFLGVRVFPPERQQGLEQMVQREIQARHEEDLPAEIMETAAQPAAELESTEETAHQETSDTPTPETRPAEPSTEVPSIAFTDALQESPSSEAPAFFSLDEEAAMPDMVTGSGGIAGSTGRAAEGSAPMEITLSSSRSFLEQPVMEPGYHILCERPDGTLVPPWSELAAFVDSMLLVSDDFPSTFRLDSLGYTLEEDGLPRVFLGLEAPLTVRIIPD